MKKLMFLVVFSCFLSLTFTISVSADATARGMGFDIDESLYGDCMVNKEQVNYSYYTKNDIQYMVGYNSIETAVYIDQTDDDWALVLYRSKVEPLDPRVPLGIFNIYFTVDSSTLYQKIYSDIDNSAISWGYGAFITSSGFSLEQPSPSISPETTEYTVSIEVGKEPKASGSITFEDNELDLFYYHSTYNNVFDVTYFYSSSWFSSVYMNKYTENIGAYLVDMSNATYSTAGTYVNTVKLSTYYDLDYWNSSDFAYAYNEIYMTVYF